MRDAALKLIDHGTSKAWRSIWLDLNEECAVNLIVVEIDPGIKLISGRETRLLASTSDLNARNAFELSANRVQGHAIHLFDHIWLFHHTVKIYKMVKLVRNPFQQFAVSAER